MVQEEISLDDVFEIITAAQMVENYPEHRRGACCRLEVLPEAAGRSTSFARPQEPWS
jgi:hypothetical protein